MFAKPITINDVFIIQPEDAPITLRPQLLKNILNLSFGVQFAILALVSQGIISVFDISEYFLRWVVDNFCDYKGLIQRSFEELEIGVNRNLKEAFYNIYVKLEDELEIESNINITGKFKIRNNSNKKELLKTTNVQMLKIRKIFWTPSFKIYILGDYEISNRVIRQWPILSDNFLRIKYSDENIINLSSFHNFSSDIEIELNNGLNICSKTFNFLGCSQSQLRTACCWLFSSIPNYLTNIDILNWLGDFSQEKNVSKIVARMGQCFSSTYPSSIINNEQIHQIPDILTPDNKYCFSDGVGRMSEGIMEEGARILGEEFTSALQCRFQGAKGVFSLDPTLHGKCLCIRPSQIKFRAPTQSTLEVIGCSKFHFGHLNQQIIILLSTLKVKDQVFMDLLEDHLRRLKGLLCGGWEHDGNEGQCTEYECLLNNWTPMVRNVTINMVKSGVVDDIFIRIINEAIYMNSLELIKRRHRIIVEKSGSLIGILDEIGILEYGEIFCRISRSNDPSDEKNITITGLVIISKNPCLYPGDIRVLQGRDNKQLHHYINVVVFPGKGKRPHPNETSGSDLDGDVYFISWDFNLIPNILDLSPPAKFPAHTTTNISEELQIRDFVSFFCRYNSRNNLGLIANAHKVWADISKKLANDPVCLRLAAEHSKEVDYAKTGVAGNLRESEKPKRYPDYMEKVGMHIYKSQTVLGKIYRSLNMGIYDEFLMEFRAEEKVIVDESLAIKGYRKYMGNARYNYSLYHKDLRRLMHKFGIINENEIITGNIMHFSKYQMHKRDFSDILEKIKFCLEKLIQKHREIFYDMGNGKSFEELKMIASAYYIVTYDLDEIFEESDAFNNNYIFYCNSLICDIVEKAIDRIFPGSRGTNLEREKHSFSFPWMIAGDILCKIKMDNSIEKREKIRSQYDLESISLIV